VRRWRRRLHRTLRTAPRAPSPPQQRRSRGALPSGSARPLCRTGCPTAPCRAFFSMTRQLPTRDWRPRPWRRNRPSRGSKCRRWSWLWWPRLYSAWPLRTASRRTTTRPRDGSWPRIQRRSREVLACARCTSVPCMMCLASMRSPKRVSVSDAVVPCTDPLGGGEAVPARVFDASMAIDIERPTAPVIAASWLSLTGPPVPAFCPAAAAAVPAIVLRSLQFTSGAVPTSPLAGRGLPLDPGTPPLPATPPHRQRSQNATAVSDSPSSRQPAAAAIAAAAAASSSGPPITPPRARSLPLSPLAAAPGALEPAANPGPAAAPLADLWTVAAPRIGQLPASAEGGELDHEDRSRASSSQTGAHVQQRSSAAAQSATRRRHGAAVGEAVVLGGALGAAALEGRDIDGGLEETRLRLSPL
jgi:hypothetical protein